MTTSVILAGGGSGGHLSPGLAVAERLHSLSPETPVHFACSDRPIDRLMLESAGASFTPIRSTPFSIRPVGLVRFVRGLARGTRESAEVLRSHQAGVVLALGGFVSAPVVRAARSLGIPAFLLNLDVVPGRANRWVAGRAQRVYTALPLGAGQVLPNLAGQVDFPIRRAAIAPADPATCRERLGLAPEKPTLLVTGASQGASSLNQLMNRFVAERPGALEGWQVLHLSGPADRSALEDAYRTAGIDSVVLEFIDQMGLAWGAAELAVSRAGANSVAEVALNRIPAIFAPYPWHKDLHQEHNARPLVEVGSARLERDLVDPDENLSTIGRALRELLLDPEARNRMRDASGALPSSDGASQVAELLLSALARGA
ncbi:MAG: UDP-N-acetylglucosamine--N-acetylmuramyl-(pentapeptide) pyrophosphoryl-undecaprenol N-acetylglucosamine transferase [Planctomycetota bacterium]|nr:UDP-N-acetylglucosamine--N-acetylmuramyl-(pentapeptide) pyrophosphoryl-undecaprenol N-acetylglucosamine transferase [Planctomycetota bacterium]